MEITTAKTAGFCFGVSRAMKLVDQLLEQGKKVCTLGPIIHNPQAVQELSDRGVVVVDDIVQCPPDGVLVIRSHGVEKKLYEELNRMNIPYMDATCPFVEKIHRIVENASLDGNTILIAGDETHPEVIGIKGFAKNPVFVFKDEKQLENILNENIFLHKSPLTVVSQTTFDVVLWRKCEKIIKKVCTNAKIFDTICDATSKRQEEAQRLSCASDLMIVIGGRQSSNTAKLKSICERNCDTVLVEMARELPADKIRCCKKIGVTAGASTPAVIIKVKLKVQV